MNKRENSYFKFLIDTMKIIQDLDYQERIWLRGEGPECNDFGDTMDDFFDFYNGIGDFENKYAEYGINIEQYLLLTELCKILSDYCYITPISPKDEVILADPRCKQISDYAKMVCASLIKLSAR